MPKDQAMDFVVAEYSHGLAKERLPRDPADIAAQASQLLDDFLEREKIERHSVPCKTRPLLMLLAEGVHLYPEELETIADYVRSRQSHLQGGNCWCISSVDNHFVLALFSHCWFMIFQLVSSWSLSAPERHEGRIHTCTCVLFSLYLT